jgi:hypothetical protein
MQVIDVDSHVTVTKGLEGTPFKVDILPDGGNSFEFDNTGLRFTPPNGKIPRPGKEPISARNFWDLDRRLDDLDRDGIDKQVLIFHTAHVFYGADNRVAIETARRYNDGLAEMIATCKAPSRYMGAAPLPLQDSFAAADEAERAVRELHMPVVVIGTNVRGHNLDMAEFEPFFARINELNVPIIIHSDGLTSYQSHPAAGERTGWSNRTSRILDGSQAGSSPNYPIWWMLTHPFEHMIAIARIIYSGMLDRSQIHSRRRQRRLRTLPVRPPRGGLGIRRNNPWPAGTFARAKEAPARVSRTFPLGGRVRGLAHQQSD